MSNRKFMFDEDVAKAMVSIVPNQVIAELAADGKAECDMFTCQVNDAHCHEIVIGHALVVIIYGSQGSIAKAQKAIMSTSTE